MFTTPIPADATRSVLIMCQGVANWFRADGPLTAEEVAERHVLLSLGTVGHPGTVTGGFAFPSTRHSPLAQSSGPRGSASRPS